MDLVKSLFEATKSNKKFHVLYVMSSKLAEEERIKEAKKCEESGYIELTRCDTNDLVEDTNAVTLKGSFTDKGREYIDSIK